MVFHTDYTNLQITVAEIKIYLMQSGKGSVGRCIMGGADDKQTNRLGPSGGSINLRINFVLISKHGGSPFA